MIEHLVEEQTLAHHMVEGQLVDEHIKEGQIMIGHRVLKSDGRTHGGCTNGR